ncbi:MAG: hypothetical protein U0164_18130 [Gemmatimonadaceae bacterium]
MRAVASTRRLFAAMTLIVATALAACGGDANAATDPDGGTNGNGGGSGAAFPTELVGTWVYGTISPTTVHDAYSGEWIDNAYGTAVLFDFKPNGTYTQSVLISTRAYSCKMQVFVYNEGRAVVEGSVIKVYPTKGSIKARDNCNAANNYDRADNIAAKQGNQYGWTFKLHDDGKTYLLIGVNNDMSNPSYFRKY